MAKRCSYPGCYNPVFSKGRCKYHPERNEMMRNGRSGATKPLSRTKSLQMQRKSTGELNLFKEIWSERPHKSFLTGKPLTFYIDPDNSLDFDIENFVKMFAHVLSKKMFPHYRLFKLNIILLTAYEHHLLDQGTDAQREAYAEKHNCSWSGIYAMQELLKKTYPVTS